MWMWCLTCCQNLAFQFLEGLYSSQKGIFSFRLLSFRLLSIRLLSGFLSHFAYSFLKIFYVGFEIVGWVVAIYSTEENLAVVLTSIES